jgi:hypothetical protein
MKDEKEREPMRIKIELDLEVEVFLKARIKGDMILTLL